MIHDLPWRIRTSLEHRLQTNYLALRSRIRRCSARSTVSSQPHAFGGSCGELGSADRDSTWRSTRLSTMVSQSVDSTGPRGFRRRSRRALRFDCSGFCRLGTGLTLPNRGKNSPGRQSRTRTVSHRRMAYGLWVPPCDRLIKLKAFAGSLGHATSGRAIRKAATPRGSAFLVPAPQEQ